MAERGQVLTSDWLNGARRVSDALVQVSHCQLHALNSGLTIKH